MFEIGPEFLISVQTGYFSGFPEPWYPHNIFFISPWEHMLWELFRSALLRHFWWVHTTYVFMEKYFFFFFLKKKKKKKKEKKRKSPYVELWNSHGSPIFCIPGSLQWQEKTKLWCSMLQGRQENIIHLFYIGHFMGHMMKQPVSTGQLIHSMTLLL